MGPGLVGHDEAVWKLGLRGLAAGQVDLRLAAGKKVDELIRVRVLVVLLPSLEVHLQQPDVVVFVENLVVVR